MGFVEIFYETSFLKHNSLNDLSRMIFFFFGTSSLFFLSKNVVKNRDGAITAQWQSCAVKKVFLFFSISMRLLLVIIGLQEEKAYMYGACLLWVIVTKFLLLRDQENKKPKPGIGLIPLLLSSVVHLFCSKQEALGFLAIR